MTLERRLKSAMKRRLARKSSTGALSERLYGRKKRRHVTRKRHHESAGRHLGIMDRVLAPTKRHACATRRPFRASAAPIRPSRRFSLRRGVICAKIWRLMARSRRALFLLASQALGETQEGLGKALGVARRTAQRWAKTGIPSDALPDLAKLVYPHDADLAAEIAAALGTTLEALGVVAPAPPPAVEAAAPPAPEPDPVAPTASAPPMPDAVVDAVVCAAAEVMNLSPRDVRAGLLAAFACAREIGLSVDAVERALRAKQPKRAPSRRQALPSPLRVERPLPAAPDEVE